MIGAQLRLILVSAIFPMTCCVLADGSKLSSTTSSKTDIQSANASYLKMYNRVQFLQDEVFRLQGTIEQFQHELGVLKKQQLQDYIALDKRLSLIEKQFNTPSTKKSTSEKNTGTQQNRKNSPVAPDHYDQYKAAYSLIKEKKFPEAKAEFKQFIKNHPGNQLVANSNYWLGELFILEKNYPEAVKCFNRIIADFPDHNKTPEAMYKLGRIYFDTGKSSASKKQMQSIVDTYRGKSINAVRLASDFLKANF